MTCHGHCRSSEMNISASMYMYFPISGQQWPLILIALLSLHGFTASLLSWWPRQTDSMHYRHSSTLLAHWIANKAKLTSFRSGTDRLNVHSWLLTNESSTQHTYICISISQPAINSHGQPVTWNTSNVYVTTVVPTVTVHTKAVLYKGQENNKQTFRFCLTYWFKLMKLSSHKILQMGIYG